jgi:hypothetical protein
MPYRAKGTKEEDSQRLNSLASEAARIHGGTVKYSFAESNMTILAFTCSKGHTFTKSIRAVVSRGGWCDFCRNQVPANQAEAKTFLGESGWILLSDYKAVTLDVKVRCRECGLEKQGPYRYYEGKPCHHRERSSVPAKLRIEQAATSMGGKLLSDEVAGLEQDYKFLCSEGHIFELAGSTVVRYGSWCKECGEIWVTPEKIATLIRNRGGVPLEPIPEKARSTTKILIACSLGHEFENDWQHMSPPRNGWCATCSKGSKSEELARTTFRQLFGAPFRKARPKWLKNSRGRQMELDGFEESLGLAFEYQGRQHFENVGIYSSEVQLEQRIVDDKDKVRLCAENGITLITLNWDTEIYEFPTEIHAQLERIRPDLLAFADFSIDINFDLAFIRDDRIEELSQALSSRNLTLISKKWIDVAYKYEIRCNVCAHEFRQSARSYLNTRKVAGCKKCAMKVTAQEVGKRKLGIDALNDIAAKNGGMCLSKEYFDVKTKYEWICARGHRFVRSLDSMQSKGSFCSPCSNGVPVVGDLRDYAITQGGALVSDEYLKGTTLYKWRCSRGHLFTRSWNQMKLIKTFCVKCP